MKKLVEFRKEKVRGGDHFKLNYKGKRLVAATVYHNLNRPVKVWIGEKHHFTFKISDIIKKFFGRGGGDNNQDK